MPIKTLTCSNTQAALGSPHLDTLLVVKRLRNILLKPGIDSLHLLIRKLVHGRTRLLAERHASATDVVSPGTPRLCGPGSQPHP